VAVRERVRAARERSRRRLDGLPWQANAEVPAGELRRRWPLPGPPAALLRDAELRGGNLRGPDRVLRMSWTLADLAGRAAPDREDVARALSLRGGAVLP